jgi:hypothetical protein
MATFTTVTPWSSAGSPTTLVASVTAATPTSLHLQLHTSGRRFLTGVTVSTAAAVAATAEIGIRYAGSTGDDWLPFLSVKFTAGDLPFTWSGLLALRNGDEVVAVAAAADADKAHVTLELGAIPDRQGRSLSGGAAARPGRTSSRSSNPLRGPG